MKKNIRVSTGQGARLLETTEPALAELVRRRIVSPAPKIFAGRREWEREHLLQAARHLGLDLDELECRLEEAARA